MLSDKQTIRSNHTDMKTKSPLISCLCVTREKPQLLLGAINCFFSQTYENKELIIVYENDDLKTTNLLNKIIQKNVKKVEVKRSSKINLGELRNIAVNNSNGEYVCQWDDDDWYHVGRLEFQFEVIRESGLAGSILTQWTVFDKTTNKAYVSNKRLWEGSILCKKSIMQELAYQNQKMGEDTAVIDYLSSKKYLFPINDTPNLYIYVYHGMNTWDYNHWSLVFKMSKELSPDNSRKVYQILYGNYGNVEASLLIDDILNNPIFEV